MSKLVEHHVKYIEIHGVDETVWMTNRDHRLLHNRIRNEGKCNVPPDELSRISKSAYSRTNKRKKNRIESRKSNEFFINYSDSLDVCIRHRVNITYYLNTGNVGVSCNFEGDHGRKLLWIDI